MTDMHKLEAIAGRTYEKTACKMRMAARIQDAMEKTGVGKKMLADMMNKRPSEVTKWLSGTHNFTLDTLQEISCNLGVNLLEDIPFSKKRIVPAGGIATWGRISVMNKAE